MCILRVFVVGVVVLLVVVSFGVGAEPQDIINQSFTRLSHYCSDTLSLNKMFK